MQILLDSLMVMRPELSMRVWSCGNRLTDGDETRAEYESVVLLGIDSLMVMRPELSMRVWSCWE